jgi:hypothetical protein
VYNGDYSVFRGEEKQDTEEKCIMRSSYFVLLTRQDWRDHIRVDEIRTSEERRNRILKRNA